MNIEVNKFCIIYEWNFDAELVKQIYNPTVLKSAQGYPKTLEKCFADLSRTIRFSLVRS